MSVFGIVFVFLKEKNMRTLYLFAILLLSTSAIGQTNASCEKLSKENTALKNKLIFLEEKVKFSEAFNNDSVIQIKSFNSDYEFKVIACKGNTNSQTVKVEVLVTLISTNQKLAAMSYGSKAIDNLGREYSCKLTFIGSQQSGNDLFTNIPVLITMEFPSVMPQTEKFELVSMTLANRKPDQDLSKFSSTEIRNIPILWD